MSALSTHSNSDLWWRAALVLAVALSFFVNLGMPLFDVDEGAFSEATREMLERGDYISTWLNGHPRYDKPILIYWLQAAAVAVFGVTEYAFRLPSALAATGWVLAVFWFVRRVRSERDAYVAALVTTFSLSVSVIAKAATADALLNLWIVLTLFAVFLHYREDRRVYIRAAFVFMALGFLTKGPVAVLVPTVVGGAFYLWRGAGRRWLRAMFDPAGIALFMVIAAPWYVLQYQARGQEFIDGFFLKHNLSRYSGPMEQHGGSLLYYVPVVLFSLMPFTGALVTVARRGRDLLRDDLTAYCLLWFGFVFVFFSLSGTKLPHYMNYGLTALTILIALELPNARARASILAAPLAMFALLLFLPDLLATWLASATDPYYREVARAAIEELDGAYRTFATLCIAVTLVLLAWRALRLEYALIICGALLTALLSLGVFPALAGALQQPVKEAAYVARERPEPVVMWHIDVPSFSVYREQVTPRRKPQPGELVLTKQQYLAELAVAETLYLKNGLVLARIADLQK